MISKPYQLKNPQENSKYFAQDNWGQIESGNSFLISPRGRSEKAYIEEGKERMKIKLNMQIYALFFSIF